MSQTPAVFDCMTIPDSFKLASLSGYAASDVLEVVRARADSGSRADGNRLALVIEGGAMRGVYTAGTLLALHLMGMWDKFDNVYGSSAGAVNAAHFLSGMGDQKVDTYYRLLADRRFFNPYRARKIVDIDFFVDEVLTKLRPVEIGAVMRSPTPLWVPVADFATASLVRFHAQAGTYPLLQILKAATAMPVLYNKLVDLGNVRGFDAGFTSPFPLDYALADRNTHILVLLARPADYISKRTRWEKWWFNNRFAKGDRRINALYGESAASSNRLRRLAHGETAPPDGISIATIAPRSMRIGRTTQNPNILRAELIEASRGTLRLFGWTEDGVDEFIDRGKS
jgi:predicted patatin/cPLA2 family phospholipase